MLHLRKGHDQAQITERVEREKSPTPGMIRTRNLLVMIRSHCWSATTTAHIHNIPYKHNPKYFMMTEYIWNISPWLLFINWSDLIWSDTFFPHLNVDIGGICRSLLMAHIWMSGVTAE